MLNCSVLDIDRPIDRQTDWGKFCCHHISTAVMKLIYIKRPSNYSTTKKQYMDMGYSSIEMYYHTLEVFYPSYSFTLAT